MGECFVVTFNKPSWAWDHFWIFNGKHEIGKVVKLSDGRSTFIKFRFKKEDDEPFRMARAFIDTYWEMNK